MTFFDSTLIDPVFDVESIGDGPRFPRAHLEVVFEAATKTDELYQTGEPRLCQNCSCLRSGTDPKARRRFVCGVCVGVRGCVCVYVA